MQLDLKQVFQQEGARLPIDLSLDFSAEEVYGAKPYVEPVKITGRVENQDSVVVLRYRAEALYARECDRCLDFTSRALVFDFEHIVMSEPMNDDSDELIFAPDFRIDLDKTVWEDILLSTPTRFLCDPECKGLCPKCGGNLNNTACGCDMSEPDPRLAALRQLLEKSDS